MVQPQPIKRAKTTTTVPTDPLGDEAVEAALMYLSSKADAAAKARAERIYLIEYRKSLKAMLMAERDHGALGAQERDAYADQRYLAHLEAIKEAVYADERHQFLREAAIARIDAWRTKQANERGAARL